MKAMALRWILPGNAYVTGDTDSTDFPTVNPLQRTAAARPLTRLWR